jgi:hypothetical protein
MTNQAKNRGSKGWPFMLVLTFAVAVVALLGVMVAAFSDDQPGSTDQPGSDRLHPKPPPVTAARGKINERAGSYAGVRLGDRGSTVVPKLGKPIPASQRPLAARDSYIGPDLLPCASPECRGTLLRYRDAEVFITQHRVSAIEVFGSGARTESGVAIGDSTNEAHAAFPSATCHLERWQLGEYDKSPRCELMLGPCVFLYFGDDPIQLIDLSALPFDNQDPFSDPEVPRACRRASP